MDYSGLSIILINLAIIAITKTMEQSVYTNWIIGLELVIIIMNIVLYTGWISLSHSTITLLQAVSILLAVAVFVIMAMSGMKA